MEGAIVEVRGGIRGDEEVLSPLRRGDQQCALRVDPLRRLVKIRLEPGLISILGIDIDPEDFIFGRCILCVESASNEYSDG
jgi:hypothetical protein